MLPSTFYATLLPTITSALVLPRAGGPPFVPIPSTCSITTPIPSGNYTLHLAPNAAIRASSLIYQAYFPLPDYISIFNRWEGCLGQCNGLTGCVAAYLVDGIKTPKGWYGTAGGERERACLMFDRALGEGDLVAKEGVGNGTVGNIECPE
ncbi:Hypothetical protein D9617_8g049810 [Elsinoe fawcettii]|nr:Hypothetical protein D9617_8g049810 [Elsinoe fawcettii]